MSFQNASLFSVFRQHMGIIDELYPDTKKFQNRFEPFFRTGTFVKRLGLPSLAVRIAFFELDHEIWDSKNGH